MSSTPRNPGQELPVLSRWFEAGSVETKEAKFLDIILYRYEEWQVWSLWNGIEFSYHFYTWKACWLGNFDVND